MAKVGTAYVEIVPDLDNFADSLRAQLGEINPKLEVKINPDFTGFAQDVRDSLADNQSTLDIPVNPDFEGLSEKVKAEVETMHVAPIKIPVELDNNVLEKSLEQAASGGARRIKRVANKVGSSFAEAVADSLARNMAKVGDGLVGVLLNPFVLPFVVAAGALASTFVLAFVGGLTAAFTGAGLVGLAGFLLRGEPAVKAAGNRLAAAFSGAWKAAAAPAVGGILTALDTVTEHITNAGHQAGTIFQGIAGPIIGLGRSIGAAIDDIMNALSLRTEGIAAGVSGLGDLVEEVGRGIAQAFSVMLADPEALRQTLNDLAVTISTVIRVIGLLVAMGVHLENFARTWIRNVGDMNDVTAEFIAHGIPGGARAIGQLWDDWRGKTDEQRLAAQQAKEANEALMDAITSRARTDNPAASMDQISDAIARVGKGFKGGIQDSQAFSSAVNAELAKVQQTLVDSNWDLFAQNAATGFTSIEQKVKDATKQVDKLIESMTILDERFISKKSAYLSFKDSIFAIAKAAKDGAKGLSDNTQAGVDNQQMVIRAAQDMGKYVTEALKAGTSIDDISTNLQGMNGDLVTQVAKFAGSRAAAVGYLTDLRALPTQILTDLALQGVPGAQEALDELTKERTVDITPQISKAAAEGIWTDRDPELKNAGAQAGTKAAEGIGAAMAAKLTAGDATLRAAGAKAAQSFATGVTSNAAQVTAASSTLMQQLSDGLQKGFSAGYDAGVSAAFGLVGGLNSESGYVYGAVSSFVQANVNQAMANALKSKSPSKVTYELGQGVAIGLAQGIDDKASVVRSSAENLYRQIGTPPTVSTSAVGGMGAPTINARIFVGDRELVDIVKTETTYADQRSARALYYGRRVG